jgi:hypothetical protein
MAGLDDAFRFDAFTDEELQRCERFLPYESRTGHTSLSPVTATSCSLLSV